MDALLNGEFRSYSCSRSKESFGGGLSGVDSYIDNPVVYKDSWEEHLRTLKELFGMLRRAKITAGSTKCLLGEIGWSS